jgi:hypothetical protein
MPKTVILPFVLYGSWSLIEGRKIFGPKREEGKVYCIKELYDF